MLFTAPTFLWLFLPAVLALHSSAIRRSVGLANAVLLAASLTFYVWGSGSLVWLLVASVGIDHVAAGIAYRGRMQARPRLIRVGVTMSVVGNVGLLAWYKYAGFLGETIDSISQALGGSGTSIPDVVLPIGLSFFTFQSMSYTIDVAHGRRAPFRNPFRLLLYVSLFPQLIAGPIVRVTDVGEEIEDRRVEPDDLASGFSRFCWGLGKKVLIADSVAPLVDVAFASEPTTVVAWVAAVGFAVQIYFDFSGYSDMAIGLGQMLGFRFPENFDRPYATATVTDFWRRWHITLSSWFRDYLYIPLGGSRRGTGRTYRNLVIVFLVTGLWHGAAWTFVLWGMWHGMAMLAERLRGIDASTVTPGSRVWTALVVLGGWLLFRAPDVSTALDLAWAGVTPHWGVPNDLAAAMTPLTVGALVGGIVVATLPRRIEFRPLLVASHPAAIAAQVAMIGVVLPLIALRVIGDTFSPFLYFRF